VESFGQTKLARVRGLTWAEIRTRFGQAISKRLDLASYRAGIRAPVHLRQQSAEPVFFFSAVDLPHRASLLHSHLPHEAAAIIQDADDICDHRFQLLSFKDLEFGASIDWHFDPVHGKRSPLRPWFKIPFLDFTRVGDHKVIWELNRHQHLVTLAKAWALTGNGIFAKECMAQFYSWQKANPYPLGINWASTLEVAFRSLSWLWVKFLLANFPESTPEFHTDMLYALHSHGRYIERYLSTYFSPNTHLLGEAVALFFLGTLCPQIPAADKWQQKGWKVILQEAERQVRADGVYFEQSLYYHVYALDFFLHARALAAKNSHRVPESFDEVIRKMLQVVDALSAAGPIEGFGDDDGGRVFNPRRNRVEHTTDPLAVGASLYGCNPYSSAAISEEAIWLFGEKALDVLARPQAAPLASSRAFKAGGIYLIYDSAPCTQQMWIDAGPQGTGNAGHGHADSLSIRYSVGGHRFLVDSGTYSYVGSEEDRNRFRGTSAHNTLSVDHLDQAIPEGPFAWSSLPNIKAETWLNGESFTYFVASHDGYQRLQQPVVHRRFVFHVKGGFWLLRDLATGRGNHHLETCWQFAPGVRLKQEGLSTVHADTAVDANAHSTRLTLFLEQNSAWNLQIGDADVSPSYGATETAPCVRISADMALSADCGVLLLPMLQPSETGILTAIGKCAAHEVRGYRYQAQRGTEFLFFGPGNSTWTCGQWNSDAELLYCRVEGNRLAHVIMVHGSFAEWGSKEFISHQSCVDKFEWKNGSVPEIAMATDFEIFDSVS
jgi:uncharacterized heparinase superfamily protein